MVGTTIEAMVVVTETQMKCSVCEYEVEGVASDNCVEVCTEGAYLISFLTPILIYTCQACGYEFKVLAGNLTFMFTDTHLQVQGLITHIEGIDPLTGADHG